MYKNKIKISLSLLFLIHAQAFSMEKVGRKFQNGTLETTLKKRWGTQTLKTYKLYAESPPKEQSFLRIAAISFLMPSTKPNKTKPPHSAPPPQLSAFGLYFENDETKWPQTKAFFETTLSDLRKQGFKTLHMHKNIYEIFKALEMEDYQDVVPLKEEPVVMLPLEKVRPPSPPPPLPPRPSTPSPDIDR